MMPALAKNDRSSSSATSRGSPVAYTHVLVRCCQPSDSLRFFRRAARRASCSSSGRAASAACAACLALAFPPSAASSALPAAPPFFFLPAAPFPHAPFFPPLRPP